MNAEMEELLRRRADRADAEPDTHQILARARALVESRRRRRRNLTGAAAGAAVMVAVLSLILVLTPGGSDAPDASPGRPAGGPPQATTSAATSESVPPATSAPASSQVPPTVRGRLVHAGVTPKPAPLAVGLVPAGWHYLGSVSDATIYGPPGTDRNPSVWAGKLALIVGDSAGDRRATPLKIAGHPARLDHDPVVGWNATIRYNKSVLISIYVPDKSRLSRQQAIQLANSLRIRDVTSVAHG